MFFGSIILEVIIGLAFVYFLFSMITSALNEWIAGILRLRSKTLRRGIQNLLNDPSAQGLAQDFFDHPLVQGLSQSGQDRLPSYIPARTFARALIDIVAPANLQDGPRDWALTYEKVLEQLAKLDEKDGLGRTLQILISDAGIDIHKIKETAQTLENLQETRKQLLDFVNQASLQFARVERVTQVLDQLKGIEASVKQAEEVAMSTIDQAQRNVEDHFNDSMERVSGWYKRQAQIILSIIATLLVLAFNVDSIAIANTLFMQPELRSSVVDLAEKYTENVPQSSTDNEIAQEVDLIAQLVYVVDETELPIGWHQGPENKVTLPETTTDWIYKIIGLLITIIAIAQGAPFWFDTINKLINIRMAGKKPEDEGIDR